MTGSTVTAIVAVIGVLVSVAVWCGCHWLANRLDRDDAKDKGEMQ